MTIRDILVQVDDTPASAPRLRAAAHLAQRLQAHLTGGFLASEVPPEFLISGEAYSTFTPELIAEVMQSHADSLARKSEAARLRFETAAAETAAPCEWRIMTGDSAAQLTAFARRSDLVIAPRSMTPCLGRARIEAVQLALNSGGPVLVTPEGDFAPSFGQRILVAWNGGREASRALRDAWPLIADAEELHILVVSPKDMGGADPMLQRLLEHHGRRANLIVDPSDDASAGDVLARQVAAQRADLVVMGLYGRPRLQELVLGGVSRHMLAHATVPLFVSH